MKGRCLRQNSLGFELENLPQHAETMGKVCWEELGFTDSKEKVGFGLQEGWEPKMREPCRNQATPPSVSDSKTMHPCPGAFVPMSTHVNGKLEEAAHTIRKTSLPS